MSDSEKANFSKRKAEWAEQIELRGIDAVRNRKSIGTSTSPNYLGWKAAVREYEENQHIQRGEQIAREEEALGISKESNEIAKDANSRATWAIVISIIAIIVSVATAYF